MRISIKYKLLALILGLIFIAVSINTYSIIRKNRNYFKAYTVRGYDRKLHSYTEKRESFARLIEKYHKEYYRFYIANLRLDLNGLIDSITYDIVSNAISAQVEKIYGLLNKLPSGSLIFILKDKTVLRCSETECWNIPWRELRKRYPYLEIDTAQYETLEDCYLLDTRQRLLIMKITKIDGIEYRFLVVSYKENINAVVERQKQEIDRMLDADIQNDKQELAADRGAWLDHLQIVLRKSIFISMVIAAVAGLVSILVAIVTTRKIKRIRAGVERIGTGDLKYQVQLDSIFPDELDDFTREFNRVTAKLEEIKMSETKNVIEKILPAGCQRIGELTVTALNLSSKDIGGDFFDIIHLPERALAVIILGDVVGKSVPAAFLMGMTVAAIRTLLRSNRNITMEEFLERLNMTLANLTESGRWVTLQLAAVNLETFETGIYNCGHPPVILASSAGVRVFESEAPMVGQLAPDDFSGYSFNQSVQLEFNDTLVMYSDGVLEAQNENGQFFGLNRLTECIGSEYLCPELEKKIVSQAGEFSANEKFKDDITILTVRRERE